MTIISKPSFYGHALSGFLIAYALYLIYFQLEQQHHNNVNIILLLAIAIGIHGLGHAYLELMYDFNPMEWKFGNEKQ